MKKHLGTIAILGLLALACLIAFIPQLLPFRQESNYNTLANLIQNAKSEEIRELAWAHYGSLLEYERMSRAGLSRYKEVEIELDNMARDATSMLVEADHRNGPNTARAHQAVYGFAEALFNLKMILN